jgi:spore maturation protein CgeB
MKLVINSLIGMPRLREGLEALGHQVVENVWEYERFAAERIDAAIFEFRTVFNRKWHFVPLAWRLRRAAIPVITWDLDAPWHMNRSQFRMNLLLKSGLLSIYACHSLQNTSWIKGCRVLYLANAAWTTVYNLNGRTIDELAEKRDFRYDVSFIGNMNGADFPEHRRRVRFLKELESFLLEKGLRVLFINASGVSIKEQIDIIQESRINLSCLSAADSTGEQSWGLTERCYGVPACGGFLLMEERAHVRDEFDADEVATYTDLEDCKEKILHYLDNEDERRRIMIKAYHRVMREHTYGNRAASLAREIEADRANI